jgi:hypothetical protein
MLDSKITKGGRRYQGEAAVHHRDLATGRVSKVEQSRHFIRHYGGGSDLASL